MQTSSERRRLMRIYEYDSVSASHLLARCAVGLGVVGIIAIAGSTMDSDEQLLADRIESEHARVGISHAAAEHERAVFASRQERFDRRFVARATYATALQVPQAAR